jgi:hypothetical protein
MEKKNQIYLAAFIMYLVVAFAGYVNQLTNNYWIVLVLSLLITAFTMSCTIGKDNKVLKETKFDWISVCAFAVVEIALTACISIAKVRFIGVFKYFNYTVQILGFLFALFAIIRFVVSYTKIDEKVKEKIANRKNKTQVMEENTNQEVASKVEETIAQEETTQEVDDVVTTDVDTVESEQAESEIIGIELKEQKEEETPYMEEEL